LQIDRRSSLIDVAFAVCTALDAVGTRAVLSGGSAATFYAPSAYQSRDCDFIITLGAGGAEASRAIAELGYTEKGGIYSHPRNPFTVEFPPGPLTVGGERVSSFETVHRGDQHLYVLAPETQRRMERDDRAAVYR
jgi:hypothetical protein